MTADEGDTAAPGPEWWRRHPTYIAGKEIGGGLWIVVAVQIYTFRVMVCDPWGAIEFYCYERIGPALLAFDEWDGTGECPVPGWTRHHGGARPRRRAIAQ